MYIECDRVGFQPVAAAQACTVEYTDKDLSFHFDSTLQISSGLIYSMLPSTKLHDVVRILLIA